MLHEQAVPAVTPVPTTYIPSSSCSAFVCLEQLVLKSEYGSLGWAKFWNLISPLQIAQSPSRSLTMQSVTANTDRLVAVEPTNVIDLAKKALSASK
ncbi:hypothetical protein GH714_028207 [Hevea brasiliensis]|uniref:Uncharacterized protein n=1 Tax=Hevea brasiliensis TaxID=3981 RepID=A0A6A6MHZ6_HEVBR|nr:hypothetical protein GH714_028207 [Hevea brasiliensis]